MAQRLAVYASQQRVTPLPRKTRLRLLAKLCRAGFAPAGFHREVSAMFSASHRVLLSRASLAQSPFHSPADDFVGFPSMIDHPSEQSNVASRFCRQCKDVHKHYTGKQGERLD